jgi:hypothetical protein
MRMVFYRRGQPGQAALQSGAAQKMPLEKPGQFAVFGARAQ